MQDWVNRKFEESGTATADKNAIMADAANIYEELWKAVLSVITAANNRSAGLRPNGFPQRYKVIMGARQVEIALAEDKLSITASYSDIAPISIEIRVRPDSTVCLARDGKPLSYTDAARQIMEPFLFAGTSPFATRPSLKIE
jgi:hypothetical protein